MTLFPPSSCGASVPGESVISAVAVAAAVVVVVVVVVFVVVVAVSSVVEARERLVNGDPSLRLIVINEL